MPYLLRKFGLLLFTAFVALTLNFFLPRLVPGDPVGAMMARYQGQLSPEAAKSLRLAYGLSDPKPVGFQYLDYLGRLARGDMGRSLNFFPLGVNEVVARAAPWTLGLVGVTTLVSFFLGSGLGLFSAWRRGTRAGDAVMLAGLFLNSVPYFWFALLVLFTFAFTLGWFPLSGGSDESLVGTGWPFWRTVLEHSVLPGITVIVTALGGWMLTMRNNAVAVLGEDYVAFARAKGLTERRVLGAYVTRNALLPSFTAFAMAIGFVVGGSILTEIVFSYPGLGQLLYQAVVGLDYPLMQAIFLFITLGVLLANFLADVAYTLLDPRVRSAA